MRWMKTTWQVYSFGKRTVLMLHLNESREGFCRRSTGRLLHVDGPKTAKARAPTVESLVRLNSLEAEGMLTLPLTVNRLKWLITLPILMQILFWW